MFAKQIVFPSSIWAALPVIGDSFGKSCRKTCAAIAQLGERQTEDLKVPGSIPGRGNLFLF